MSRLLWIIGGVGLILLLVYLISTEGEAGDPAVTGSDSAARMVSEEPVPGAATVADRTELRPSQLAVSRKQIQDVVEADLPTVGDAQQLRKYLDELGARAIARGHVTAFEMEPGIEAIRRHADELGPQQADLLIAEFSARMLSLSRAFEGTPEGGVEQPVEWFDSLYARIVELESEPEERQQAISTYLSAVQTVEDELTRIRLMERLGTLVSSPEPDYNGEYPPNQVPPN